ncbi:MAG TPA: hypothetical protein VMT16_05565 [Thermoanaerobaculia bacterium]|nr:hypothetical protein [Thermoanaerobaculia bacterium]
MPGRIALVALALVAGTVPAAAAPSPLFLPGGRAAEAELAAARAELQELAGEELLRAPAPPLPRLSLRLEPAERRAVRELLAVAPDAWSRDDRALAGSLTGLHGAAIDGLGGAGERLAASELTHPALGLIQAARLQSLRGRLALQRGDEAALLADLEAGAALAERLHRQPFALGAVLAAPVHGTVLADVRLAVAAPATTAATLEALDALLLRGLDLPDAAAVLALEGLHALAEMERAAPRELGGTLEGPVEAWLMAPVGRDYADLARLCRQHGCARAAAELEERRSRRTPERVIADLLLPQILDIARKVEDRRALVELARTAVALRLQALDTGAYPAGLDALPATLAAARGELPGLAYERHPGGARLSLPVPDRPLPEPLQQELSRLHRWELPPPPPRDEP